jgi:hypothetical protein
MRVQSPVISPFSPAESHPGATTEVATRFPLFQKAALLDNPLFTPLGPQPAPADIDWGAIFGPANTPPPGPSGHLPPTGPYGDTMPFYDQGDSQACATTSLSMILKYLGVDIPPDQIDEAIRRTNNGTPLNDLIDFARDHGVEAQGYNNGSWEDVKSQIDQGHPVAADIKSGDNTHVIVITGYYTDANGVEHVQYHDPNFGDENGVPGHEQSMTVDDFKSRWGDTGWGLNNYYIAFGPKGADLPPGNDNGAEGILGVQAGGANVANGLDRIRHPENFGTFVHGFPEFFGGLFQTAGCGLGAGMQAGAKWLSDKVEGIPVLENVVQPFTDIFSGAGACIADVFNGFGEACNDIGGAFDSLFNGDLGGFFDGVGDAAGDVVSGAADAISDAAGAVGDAISDVFSGW